jgi:spore coat polysaccharide biosynthesis predicted glycosyltransferase SpsG
VEDAGVDPALTSDGKGEEWDALATLALVGEHPVVVSWIVLDSYVLGSKWEEIVRCGGHRILAIDDLRDRVHDVDILVSDSGAPFDPALLAGRQDVRVLNAPEFTLVDPEFKIDPESIEKRRGPMRLLVTYGGSDLTNETGVALQALESAGADVALAPVIGPADIVLGHTHSRKSSILKQSKAIPSAVIHQEPESLAPLMKSADIILSSGGNSMVEAVAMRKPCLVTITSENQEFMTTKLQAHNLVRVAGRAKAVTPGSMLRAIASLVNDYAAFSAFLHRQTVIDLHGARRIVKVICEVSSAIV